MTSEDRATEIADYVAYLAALHAEIGRSLAAAPPRVGLLGFSQGTATACRCWMSGASSAACGPCAPSCPAAAPAT